MKISHLPGMGVIRTLLNDRGFVLAAVLTLALGIGSVSAIFSVVNGVLLKPLPYPAPDRIVRLDRTQGVWTGSVSGPVFEDWRHGTSELFSAFSAFQSRSHVLEGGGVAEQVTAYRVSAEFWDVMGLAPAHGRYFNPAEDDSGERVVVLGHALWQRRYGGDPEIVGRNLQLDGQSYRVIGVTPSEFRYPGRADLFVPLSLAIGDFPRGNNNLLALARLVPGAGKADVEAALGVVNARLAQEYPQNHADLGVLYTRLSDRLNSRIEQPLLILLGASALVLLIACINFGNLLIVRGTKRNKELALRAALGAGGRDLVRMVLGEALALAVVGGIAGVLLAAVGVPALLRMAPDILPSHASVSLDWSVVAFSFALGLVAAVLFSIWPALGAARVSPGLALQEAGRSNAGGSGRSWLRSTLVVAEVALSLVLLVSAGLMIESLRRLSDVDTPVEIDSVLTAGVALRGFEQEPGESMDDWYRRHSLRLGSDAARLVETLQAIPGVERVAMSDALPLSGRQNTNSNVNIIGAEPPADGQQAPWAQWRFVNPDFFAALGVEIKQGRALEDRDWLRGEAPVAIVVNETFVRRFLNGGDAIGRQIQFFGDQPKTIVGVVEDTRLHGLDSDPLPEAYMHFGHNFNPQLQVGLRTNGNPAVLAEALREAIRRFDTAVPVYDIMTMSDKVSDSNRLRRFNMTLMTVFSGVSLALALVGLYGVIAYSVGQRRHEIGVRLSLGATSGSVRRLIVGQGLRLALFGSVLGLFGAAMAARTIQSQLFGIGAIDPGIFLAVAVVLMTASFLACLVPAWQAGRIAPMDVFRQA